MTSPQVLGIDVDAAETLARVMNDSALAFNERANQLTTQLDSVAWSGNYANRFRDQWNNQSRQNLATIVQMLQEASQQLAQHAQAQRQLSGG